MAVVKLLWSNLLKLTELDFRPDFPAQLNLSDEVLQVISWLTATTGFDRRLLRCTRQGALLVAKPWSMMNVVDNKELTSVQSSETAYNNIPANDGILITSSTQIIKVSFRRKLGSDMESVFVPPASYYWFPFSTYGVVVETVPDDSGTVSIMGITAYKT